MSRLPSRPDLTHLKREAKRRRHDGEFSSLALAQLAVARDHGFASWPRLKFAVEARTLGAQARAQALVASATSSDLRRARALLDADPTLARHDLACACVTGDANEVARRIAGRPALAVSPTGPDGRAPILYACFSRLLTDPAHAPGIRAVVGVLLGHGADPNAYYVDGGWLQVALYGAAGIAGDPELTATLLAAGADPTDEREGLIGNEVLYHAVEHRDPTCARLVVQAGARRGLVDHALRRALDFPRHAMVQMLCDNGARPTAEHLHVAVWRARPPHTVAALLDAGAPVNGRDEEGRSPLQVATRWGNGALIALLTERGGDVSEVSDADRALGRYLGGGSPQPPDDLDPALLDAMVMTAVERVDADALTRLLAAGAPPDGDPGEDHGPLATACWHGQVALVQILLARGARTSFSGGGSAIGAALHGSRHCNDPEGGPTMAPADEIAPEPYARIVTALLQAGAEVPERLGERGPRAVTLMAELGVTPPS